MYPVLFTLGGVEFYSYGLMVGIGYLLGVFVASKMAEKKGIDPDSLFGLFILLLVTGALGGRLLHIVLNTWNYRDWKTVLDLRDGGFSIHGVLLSGIITVALYCRFQKINALKLLDLLVPSVALGQSIGRIGCLLSGCCYGIPTNGQWGVLTRYAPGLRHPYQIYESVANFLLFIVLIKMSSKASNDGALFLAYVLGYSIIRFFVEFFRANDTFVLGLSYAQWLSAAGIVVCLTIYVYKRSKTRAESRFSV